MTNMEIILKKPHLKKAARAEDICHCSRQMFVPLVFIGAFGDPASTSPGLRAEPERSIFVLDRKTDVMAVQARKSKASFGLCPKDLSAEFFLTSPTHSYPTGDFS
jgi:hypothetical protein